MKRILVFDPFTGGHRKNFIHWTARAARASGGAASYVFVTASEMVERDGDGVVFHPLPESVTKDLDRAGWWKRRQEAYRRLKEACLAHQPSEILLLDLTYFEWHLLLFGLPTPLSAIVFVQPTEIPSPWKRAAKLWKTRLLLKRVSMRTMFFLNGERAVSDMWRRMPGATRFEALPDPVVMGSGFYPPTPRPAGGTTRFLFFGAISARKGVFVLFESLRELSSEVAGETTFRFLGRPEDPEAFEAAWERLCADRPDLSLELRADYVTDEEMMAAFDSSDVVLMPYLRPEYSSGVLAIAASRQRMVLGPEGGLLGALIRENGLGLAVPITPPSLADALGRLAAGHRVFDPEKAERFSRRSTPDAFGAALLAPVEAA